MKKTCLIFLVALLPLIAATPARADLIIQNLSISVLAHVEGIPADTSNTIFTGSPFILTATAVTPVHQALATQGTNGYFWNQAISTGQTSIEGPIAATGFHLVVGADAPNTPVVVDTYFFGAQAAGTAYYGQGDMRINIGQIISTRFNNDTLTKVWGFTDRVALNDNGTPGWSRTRVSQFDTLGVGLPTETLTATNYVNSFTESLSLELDPFHCLLDFGLLQPGETFTLDYESFANMEGGLTLPFGDARGVAKVVDPFSLGGSQPPQIALQGLTLPSFSGGSAPEPGTLALLTPGALLLVGALARRRRTV